MKVSHNTLVMLARSGDIQAIEVLRQVENLTEEQLTETEVFFQDGPGLFHKLPPVDRKHTMLGMPAMTPERVSALLGARANRS